MAHIFVPTLECRRWFANSTAQLILKGKNIESVIFARATTKVRSKCALPQIEFKAHTKQPISVPILRVSHFYHNLLTDNQSWVFWHLKRRKRTFSSLLLLHRCVESARNKMDVRRRPRFPGCVCADLSSFNSFFLCHLVPFKSSIFFSNFMHG